ncbi:MAG: alpha/beta fold hydrolase [Microthrixaceae bacterium]
MGDAVWPLSFSQAGEGGRPLLLVHGFTGGRADFAEWMEPLADRGHHVVVPDLRGHGVTGGPDELEGYSLELMADDLVALTDRLGWDRFDLLGHSMGGLVAQRLVVARPELVGRLVLMDTTHGAVPGMDPAMLELAIELAAAEGMQGLADAMDALGASPLETEAARRVREERPDLVALDRAKFLAAHPAMYATMGRVLVNGEDRLHTLSAVTAPTLVIVGELDTPFLPGSRALARTIPGAELALIPQAGHSPQREAPEAWWSALSGFLADGTETVTGGANR